ncbi:unnamed protein product [Pichia kudriavzevii]
MNDAVNDEEQGNFSETKQKAIDTGKYSAFDFKNRPPDGGFWAWISVVCVLFINTFSWGLNACFGVYLNYYVTEKYFENANTEQYVMIGGLALGLSFTACAFTNGLCRHVHYKIIMTIGLIITFLSYWLASIATTVVQLIFFQGFLMAFGWALTAGSTFLILPTWFLEKRSIAQGIATAGGGLGGIIFSRASDQIIKQYLTNPKYAGDPNHALRLGVAWALRMEALVCGFMLAISIILIRTYRPIKNTSKDEKPLFIELTAFLFRFDLMRQIPLICLMLWNMVYSLSYSILLFSLSAYGSSIGLSYKQGSNVTTVQSVAQTVGRPLLGFLSDKIGRVNVTLISTILITIFSFVFWIFVTTYAQLIGFAFAVGILLGVNWVNFGPMTADVVGGGGADMNHAVSLQMFVGGFPMLIAELAGFKLRRFDMERPFLYCQILVGVAAGVSCLALLPFREWKVKRAVKARIAYLKHSVNNLDGDEEEEEEDAALAGMDGEQMERKIMKMERLLAADVRSYMYRAVYPLKV